MLIDTGIAVDGEEFIEALSSVIGPAALRWLWLIHDDADHTGQRPTDTRSKIPVDCGLS